MKTTAGKSKPVRGTRVVRIYRLDGDKLLSVVRSTSLKQALLDYFERTLSGYGYKNPKVTGNVLTVTFRRKSIMYRALDANQRP
jgi:hypothetical protein